MARPLIRRLAPADQHLFAAGVALLNDAQGSNLFTVTYLDERTARDDSAVWVALMEDTVVGIGVAQLVTEFEFYLPFDATIRIELADKIVGGFSTLAFVPAWRGKGLGQEISRQRLAWLRERGCQVILGISWVSGLGHTSDRVFDKMGFRAVKRLDNFFVEWSLNKPDFVCPVCGAPPCRCAAIFYRKDLTSVPSQ